MGLESLIPGELLHFLVNGRGCGEEDLEVGLESLIPRAAQLLVNCRGCGREDLEVGLESLIPGELLNFLVNGRGCGGEDLEVRLKSLKLTRYSLLSRLILCSLHKIFYHPFIEVSLLFEIFLLHTWRPNMLLDKLSIFLSRLTSFASSCLVSLWLNSDT